MCVCRYFPTLFHMYIFMNFSTSTENCSITKNRGKNRGKRREMFRVFYQQGQENPWVAFQQRAAKAAGGQGDVGDVCAGSIRQASCRFRDISAF